MRDCERCVLCSLQQSCLFNAACFQYLTAASPSPAGLLNVSIHCVCIQFSDMTRQDSFSTELAVSALCLTCERGERRETDYNYQFGSLPCWTILVIKLANYIDKAWQGGKSRNVCQFWPLFFSASGKSLLLKDKKYLRTNI